MCSSNLSVRCFAKINTHLRVLGTREDGFHEIETVFQSIDLHDSLHLRLLEGKGGVALRCDDPTLQGGSENLAVLAAREFSRLAGLHCGVRLELEKKIPVAAGLGGGSSDAAATLRAMNLLCSEPVADTRIAEAAARLGSDVPYFLLGGRALGRGRGERLQALEDSERISLLLLAPRLKISARRAYELFDLTIGDKISDSTLRLSPGESMSSGNTWQNDLERGVFGAHRDLAILKDGLLEAGAAEAVMSGSGSVIVGKFADEGAAEHAALLFRGRGVGAFVCSSLSRTDFHRRFLISREREE
jgi:4-diphosphocytidyl-2-C-methyl-D-erythritol kinase